MKVYNKTIYDKQLIIDYNKYYFFNFLTTKFSFMSALIIGFSVYLIIIKRIQYAAILICVLIGYLFLVYLLQLITTKRTLKRNPIVENPVLQEYLFQDDEILISYNKKIKYNQLYKVSISKRFILLFSLEKRTYIVNKEGFSSKEEAQTIETFLKSQIKENRHKKS